MTVIQLNKQVFYNLLKNPLDKEDKNIFYPVYKVAENFIASKPSQLNMKI